MIIKNDIKAGIKAAFESVMNDQGDNREAAIDTVAGKIADVVAAAIKSADINYTAGLISPSGPVTGVFEGNLL
jgi:hypothetical protein